MRVCEQTDDELTTDGAINVRDDGTDDERTALRIMRNEVMQKPPVRRAAPASGTVGRARVICSNASICRATAPRRAANVGVSAASVHERKKGSSRELSLTTKSLVHRQNAQRATVVIACAYMMHAYVLFSSNSLPCSAHVCRMGS